MKLLCSVFLIAGSIGTAYLGVRMGSNGFPFFFAAFFMFLVGMAGFITEMDK